LGEVGHFASLSGVLYVVAGLLPVVSEYLQRRAQGEARRPIIRDFERRGIKSPSGRGKWSAVGSRTGARAARYGILRTPLNLANALKQHVQSSRDRHWLFFFYWGVRRRFQSDSES
jgi:hypothetical protein